MKKLWITLFLVAIGATTLFAQEKSPKAKTQARLTYMKEHVTVNEKVSQNFWKTYEQYLKDQMSVMETYKKNLEKQGIKIGAPGTNKEVIEKLSDKQLSYLQDQKLEMRKKMLDLEYSYHKKFKTMLTPRELQKLYDTEYQYKKTLTNTKKDSKKEIEHVNTGKKKR